MRTDRYGLSNVPVHFRPFLRLLRRESFEGLRGQGHKLSNDDDDGKGKGVIKCQRTSEMRRGRYFGLNGIRFYD